MNAAVRRAGISDAELEELLVDTPATATTTGARPRISTAATTVDGPSSSWASSKVHGTTYEFPCHEWEPFAEWDDQRLLAKLRELLGRTENPGALARYTLHRTLICQLALALNRRGNIAPRFRPIPSPGFRCRTGSVDEQLGRDRQVLDLHWLYENGHCRKVDSREFRDLFATAPFDFQLASNFACKNWTSEKKLAALGVERDREAELAAIQTEQLRMRWRGIDRKEHQWRTQLGNALRRRPNLRCHIDGWIRVRVAMELLGVDAPVGQLSRLVALITGEKPIDQRAMARKRASVMTHLGL
ncbi:hypothetical protein KTE23_02590 [Burkholderia multivorans]|uniref:hypothetical protein n=1 Tax=Burkholderia multivorans TaxID=87883 RepID=UPI0012DF1821|nr:hypothetical protein [Burkholderia multivorans]MBU9415468.1 hypothetical protein [Burkholderia multivorans]QGR88205.1 hypothetical protein FOC34_23855 [Burkholderia multivorans]